MNKDKYSIEYIFDNVSTNMMWPYISTAAGLSVWFAENVVSNGKEFTFFWDNEAHRAEMIGLKSGIYIRFRWITDSNVKSYFELKISYNEMVKNAILEITDFASSTEMNDGKMLWDKQVSSLRKHLGA